MSYVLFREDSNSHKEVYLARDGDGFISVPAPGLSNLQFEDASEAYTFAGEFPVLQSWRVGQR